MAAAIMTWLPSCVRPGVLNAPQSQARAAGHTACMSAQACHHGMQPPRWFGQQLQLHRNQPNRAVPINVKRLVHANFMECIRPS